MEVLKTGSRFHGTIQTANIDTDQIIPARFLKHHEAPTTGNFYFTYAPAKGEARTKTLCQTARIKTAGILLGIIILVAVLRESAVYALHDAGIKCASPLALGILLYQFTQKRLLFYKT